MNNFGNCATCPTPAIVKLNGHPYCLDHYTSELRDLGFRISGIAMSADERQQPNEYRFDAPMNTDLPQTQGRPTRPLES